MLKRGMLVGRSLGERHRFWDSQRDAWTEVSVIRVQKGMVKEGCLSIWIIGNQAVGECLEGEIQEQLWKVGVCAFPQCLQGFANLFTGLLKQTGQDRFRFSPGKLTWGGALRDVPIP